MVSLLQLGLEGFSFLGFTETLNWTTDSMSTPEVSDGCGQFVTVNTEVIVVSPPLDVTLPDTLIGPHRDVTPSPGIVGGSGVYTMEDPELQSGWGPIHVQLFDGLPTTFAVEITDTHQQREHHDCHRQPTIGGGPSGHHQRILH